MPLEKSKTAGQEKDQISESKDLMLFNDDFNTFEHVIDSLVEVCNHETHQAEQCAVIAHYKGKCTVNSGSWNELKPQHDELTHRGLSVTIV